MQTVFRPLLKPCIAILLGLLIGTAALIQVAAQESTETSQLSVVANVVYPAEDGSEISGYLAVPDGVDASLLPEMIEAAGADVTATDEATSDEADMMATEEAEAAATDEAAEPAETVEPDADGLYPAVLMVHEWWGLNEEMTEMADILAAEGYVVLAVDTYRGVLATTVPAAIAARTSADPVRVDSDMQAAYAYLASLPFVDVENIGVIGFCYGGGVALRHGTQNAEITAVVDLYGETIDDPEGFGALLENGAEVLGIFGSEDEQFPAERIEAFDMALTDAGVVHAVTVYDGVGHAFVNPEALETTEQAQDAWDQVLTFLEENLKDEAAAS